MKKQQIVTTFGVFCVLLVAVNTARAQGERIIAELGGVQMLAIDQDPALTPGYNAARIVLRSNPGTSLVTFENLRIEGPLVQTWLSGPFGGPTAKNVVAGPTYPGEWVPYDSHLNITSVDPNMLGGQAGNGFNGISETNDMSIGEIPGLPRVQNTPSVSGIGPISMVDATDAFFLAPEFQTNEVDLAYVVCAAADGGGDNAVFMSVEIGRAHV
jgi:hypothetical protein